MYKDRLDAGKQLAEAVEERGYEGPIIFALTRGGLPVGKVIADKLKEPLMGLVVRKLSLMEFPELGFGAIAPEGVFVVDNTIVDELGIDHDQIQRIKAQNEKVLIKQLKAYEIAPDAGDLSKNTAILVDDGIATGISVKAAAMYLRKFNPAKLVLAVPVCPSQAIKVIEKEFDETICLKQEEYFFGVSQFYELFPQVTDQEVEELLKNR